MHKYIIIGLLSAQRQVECTVSITLASNDCFVILEQAASKESLCMCYIYMYLTLQSKLPPTDNHMTLSGAAATVQSSTFASAVLEPMVTVQA